jgi:PAS domain S-box-containing protein
MGRFMHQSLRFKMTAGVVAILIVAMGIVFSLQYRWVYQEMIERLGLSSTPLSDVIKGSLKHAMQTRDLSEVAAIIDNVSRQPGVIKVFVVDKRGRIMFSPVKAEIGTRISLEDPTCQICHHIRVENRNKTVIFAAAGGGRVFRNVSPIANEPACFGCHDSKDKLNGVLISDFSMAEIDRQLASKFWEMVLALFLAVGATGLTITLIMNRLVIGKLEKFVRATKLLGKGTLDLEVKVGSRDEIGELATSFNEMVEGLRRARAIRERKELLENVLNNVAESVIVFDANEVVIAMNRGAELAFDLRASEVVGRAYTFFGEDHEAILGRAKTAGPVTTELTLRSKDSRSFPARVHVTPLRGESNDLLGCVAVAQDLTGEKTKERLQEQLLLSEKLAAVGRLAAGVAHELNNPLGNVLLYAKLFLEDLPASDAGCRNARHIVDNTLRCKAIVRSLLDYAKQSDIEMAWTDANAILKESVDLVANALRLHDVACHLDLDPALPVIRCDRQRIQQVLLNLMQNAIEAIGHEGTVTVFSRRFQEGDGIVLGVSDDGRGIPADSLSRVFEPFYTTKEQGTGLGLSICYGIVERHKGKIWAESPRNGAGGGSTFFVKLPVGGEAAP